MSNRINKIVRFSKSSRRNLLLLTEIFLGFVIVSLFSLIFLKLGDGVLDRETISFDNSVMSYVLSQRNPGMTEIMTAISFFGSAPLFGLIIIVSVLVFLRKNFRQYSIFSLTIFSGFSFNLLLKDTFQRPRPLLHSLIHESSFSFPSGHAMDSLIFYISLSYLVYRCTKNKFLGLSMAIFSGIIVFLIGISRIYLGVHYPSDVVAGYSVGIIWFLLVVLFEKTHLFVKLFRDFEKQINS